MKNFKSEVEFKTYLDSKSVRYGDFENRWNFIIEFYDNKSGTQIARKVDNSPIAALRNVGQLLEAAKLPYADLTVVLRLCYSVDISRPEVVCFDEPLIIEPTWYLKIKEEKTETK